MNIRALIKNEKKEREEHPKPNKILIFIIIAAILILAVSSFFDGGKEKEKKTDLPEKQLETGQYIKDMELRLAETLKKISGAGNVSVFISIDSGGEKILASNTKEKVAQTADETQHEAKESDLEKSVVLTEDGAGEVPYVVEEKLPVPTGILVVAEGAKDEKVKFEIYDAIKAIYGLSAHRIKVTY